MNNNGGKATPSDEVLNIAKHTLIQVIKTLISEPDKCVKEEGIRAFLNQNVDGLDDESLNLIIQKVFNLATKIEYLETGKNQISMNHLPSENINQSFEILVTEVERIFEDIANDLTDKSEDELPEDWVSFDDKKEIDWSVEIARMQERIIRRRAGEELTED